MIRWFLVIACACLSLPLGSAAQTAASAEKKDGQLKFVVYVSRHGVRAPTGKAAQYDVFSNAAWPTWDVQPAYLTAHGYELMRLFGVYDRMQLASLGLLSEKGCADAASVRFYADSDQRTKETGKAMAEGLYPGCGIAVPSLAEGVADPMFHAPAQVNPADRALAAAAIAGRIGGSAENLTAAYHSQLAELDQMLATCGSKTPGRSKRTSLFDIPTGLTPGAGDKAADLKGPLNTAATLMENMLLEYTTGMDAANVGWGCMNAEKLRSLMELHTSAEDIAQRTPAVARVQASNLLGHVERALEQAATGKAVAGSPSKPSDRALFLIGHDTNLANISGLLNTGWIADGRRDDTAPGSAMVFELWKKTSGEYVVKTYLTVQTIEQMRSATALSLSNPPQRVPLFIPSCSTKDFSCSWTTFSRTIQQAIDPHYLTAQ